MFIAPRTFSDHARDTKFRAMSYMDEAVGQTPNKAVQHLWLSGCVPSFFKVILL